MPRKHKMVYLSDLLIEPMAKQSTPASLETNITAPFGREEITFAVDSLKQKEREVIQRRFGLEGDTAETLEAIGRALGCTRERVRQIERHALVNLKNHLTRL